MASDWSREQGRARRVYRLTDRGRDALRRERRDWRRFVAAADRILGSAVAADG